MKWPRSCRFMHLVRLMMVMVSASTLTGAWASVDDCKVTAANPEWVNPTTVSPDNGLTFVNLTVRLGTNMIGPDRVLHRSYNGAPVGPVIRAQPGGELIIHLENKLPIEPIDIGPPRDMTPGPQGDTKNPHSVNFPHGFNTTNIHTHGLHISPNDLADNVFREIDPLVKPEATFRYVIPADHPSGTFWYHAHKHGSVGYQLASGMAGALIVEGGLDRYAGLKGVKEKIMVFQQVPYRPVSGGSAQIFPQDVYSEADFGNAIPPTGPSPKHQTLINGQLVPVIRIRPGDVQRFRMIHAGIETSLFVHLDGHVLYEVALDGIPLKELRKWESAKGGSVELEPGYRSDVLVRASATPGTYCLYNEIPPSLKAKALRKRAVTRTNLALIVVEGDPVTTSPDITSAQFADDLKAWATDYLTNKVPKLKDIEPSEITGKRKLTFDAVGPKAFYIDDRTFDEKRPPDQVITLGAVEEWTISAINESHPFHIHVNPFLVQERYPDNTLKWVWRDTFLVPEGQTATIRSRFLDFEGRTVLHCHNLDHEDLGMMQVVQIVKNGGGAAPARGLSSLPRPAPDWTLEDTDGRRSRRSDYDGKAHLLVFHRGLDCLHCSEQITALARSASRFRALGVEILAVSPCWPDLDALRKTRERLGIDFPLLADPNLEVFRRYGCQGDPPFHGVFLIDAASQVRWQSVSDQPESDMDRLVDLARRHLASGRGQGKQGISSGSENQTLPLSPSQAR